MAVSGTIHHTIFMRCRSSSSRISIMVGVVAIAVVFAVALVGVAIASPASTLGNAMRQDVPLILGTWDASKCKAKFASGETFKLKAAANPKGYYTTSSDGFSYLFQVCGNMVFTTQAEAPKCGFSSSNGSDCPRACMGKVCGDACAAIQVSNSTSSYFTYCYTAGQAVDLLTGQSDVQVSLLSAGGRTTGVRYTTQGGDSDYCESGTREMNVDIMCPTAALPASMTPSPVTSPSDNDCLFTTVLSHAAGCPVYGDGDSGYAAFCWYLVVFFFTGIVVYVGGFAAYNYKVLELRGVDLLPHREFWSEQPGQMKDGAMWTWEKMKQGFAYVQGKIQGYRQIN